MSFPTIGYRPRGIFELKKRNNESGEMQHIGYGLFDPMPEEAKKIYEPIKADFQERFRMKIAEGKEKGGKYKEKWETAQKEKSGIMLKLHESGAIDDDQLMQLFGYDNKGTFKEHQKLQSLTDHVRLWQDATEKVHCSAGIGAKLHMNTSFILSLEVGKGFNPQLSALTVSMATTYMF